MFQRKFYLVLLLVALTRSALLAAEWETDYGKALEKAKAEKKRVLLDFTGSDWCPPCIELKRLVFSRPDFAAYAKKNLILVEIDFPKGKKQSDALKDQNEMLAKQYRIDEKVFPTVIVLDSAGKIAREFSGYGGETAADLIAWIEGRKKM